MKGTNEMNINKEKKKLLRQELKEYEKITPMTPEEKEVLHQWVNEGNSVHENDCMAFYDGGRPMDFLDVYREYEELRKATAGMTFEEETRYLLIEHNIIREPGPTTPDKEAIIMYKVRSEYYQHLNVLYWDIISMNGLCEEAWEHVREHINDPYPSDFTDLEPLEEGGIS